MTENRGDMRKTYRFTYGNHQKWNIKDIIYSKISIFHYLAVKIWRVSLLGFFVAIDLTDLSIDLLKYDKFSISEREFVLRFPAKI